MNRSEDLTIYLDYYSEQIIDQSNIEKIPLHQIVLNNYPEQLSWNVPK